MVSLLSERIIVSDVDVRLFLFHTALASGAAGGLPPFTPDSRWPESRVPEPVFATNRGLDTDSVADPVGGVLEPDFALSLTFAVLVGAVALDARKVLLTETALKVAGFLTEDAARPWFLSPSLSFALSAREASVSEPPLTLAAAELARSSTFVMRLFSISS